MSALVRLLTLALLLAPLPLAAQRAPDFDDLAAGAAAAREGGDLSRAIELYRQAVGLKPSWPDGWWYLGSLEYGADQYRSAADALTHYIDMTPSAGPAIALRGLCEFEQEQYAPALEDLTRAIGLGAASEPRNAGILYYHEAQLLARVGRYEEALGQYTTLVKHGGAAEDVLVGIGLAGLRMPRLPRELDPGQRQLVQRTGAAAASVMSGDLESGRRAFEELFALTPTPANLHYLYGYLLFGVDPPAAVAQFRRELEVSPSSAVAHAMLAWAVGVEGDFAAALPDARAAVAEDPSLPMAELVLGKDLVETGDVAGGLSHLEAVLKMDPRNLEAHIALAKAYSELGRKDDARRERLLCLSLSGRQATPDANP